MPQTARYQFPAITAVSTVVYMTVVNPSVTTQASSLAVLELLYGCQWVLAY